MGVFDETVSQWRNEMAVILNGVKNLDRLIGYKRRDPSASPQDDIAIPSLAGEGMGEGFANHLPAA